MRQTRHLTLTEILVKLYVPQVLYYVHRTKITLLRKNTQSHSVGGLAFQGRFGGLICSQIKLSCGRNYIRNRYYDSGDVYRLGRYYV